MAMDGSDVSPGDWGGQDVINYVKNNWASASAPANPATGCSWYDDTNDTLKVWNGTYWQDAVDAYGVSPVGAIVAWCPGYFGDGSNGSYTNVLGAGNTVAQQNTYLNSYGWYVCDGAAVSHASSSIWNAASRYLPNLTADRFIMGDTVVLGEAATVGSNTMAHTHQCNPVNKGSGGPSNTVEVEYLSEDWSCPSNTHTHDVDIPEFASGAASDTENRPLFLGLYYIVRVF